MHVKDRTQAVAGVGLKVGAVAVLCRLVEVVVLRDEGFELALNVYNVLA